jgi:hypothetical protein
MQNFRIAICLAGINLILLIIVNTIKIVNNFYYFRTIQIIFKKVGTLDAKV